MYERLARHVPKPSPHPEGTASAVLVTLCAEPGGDRLLYTKRPDTMGDHGGQICFPGGKTSPEDRDLVATALREAHEEVGIRPEDVEILGVLDDVRTTTGFTITPVVGRIPCPYPFRPSPREIDRLIEVPLADVLHPDTIELATRMGPGGLTYHIYSFSVGSDLIWGATARITRQLVSVLTGDETPLAPELVELLKERPTER